MSERYGVILVRLDEAGNELASGVAVVSSTVINNLDMWCYEEQKNDDHSVNERGNFRALGKAIDDVTEGCEMEDVSYE